MPARRSTTSHAYTTDERRALIYRRGVQLASRDDLDPLGGKFVGLTKYAATLYDNGDTDNFVLDLTCVINGYCNGDGIFVYQVGFGSSRYPGVQGGPYFLDGDIFRGKGNWADRYYDDSDNQMYHFWFYVALSYFDSGSNATVGNIYHDPVLANPLHGLGIGPSQFDIGFWSKDRQGVSVQDNNLGAVGIALGTDLAVGYVQISEVGDWIWRMLNQANHSCGEFLLCQ